MSDLTKRTNRGGRKYKRDADEHSKKRLTFSSGRAVPG